MFIISAIYWRIDIQILGELPAVHLREDFWLLFHDGEWCSQNETGENEKIDLKHKGWKNIINIITLTFNITLDIVN